MSYEVDPQALQSAAKGIQGITDGLTDAAGDMYSASSGAGFDRIKLPSLKTGGGEFHGALGGFADRGKWALRTLVRDGYDYAKGLNMSVGAYKDRELYAQGTFKTLAADIGGNPHLTDEEAANTNWGDLMKSKTGKAITGYNAEDWNHVGTSISDSWTAEGHDIMVQQRQSMVDQGWMRHEDGSPLTDAEKKAVVGRGDDQGAQQS